MSAETPLQDIRIIDLTMGWSGPLATRHLADMGADVIKIESCVYPDWWRGWEYTASSIRDKTHEKSPAFNQVNRNKRGVAIDLTKEAGRDIALRLVQGADAVIENQATGVLSKLGLSYETLRAANPEIILLSLPAFGATGPWAGYRGYGSTVEHGAGLPYLTGDPDGPPVQTHVAYGDACGGINAAAALLVGLFHRKRTGEGQRIEISQVECIMQLGIHGTIAQGMTGAPPVRTGNRHPVFVPHGCFAGDRADSWVVIAITDDRQWAALCSVIERGDLAADGTLAAASGRRRREEEIETAIGAWTRTLPIADAMQRLQESGVPAAAVNRASDLLDDAGFVQREFWQVIERAIVGAKPHPAAPWKVDGHRLPVNSPAPLLGEHNSDILREVLGMDDAEVKMLESQGIIGTQPLPSGS